MHRRARVDVPERGDFRVPVDDIGRQIPRQRSVRTGWPSDKTIIRRLKTTPEKLESELQRGLAPVYLISGDEPLTAGEAADALRAAARAQGYAEREVFFIERANSSGPWDEIHAAAQALSLFATRRLIEVRIPGGKPGTGAKVLQELVALAGSDFLLLVITGALDWETQKAGWVQSISNAGVWVVAEDVSAARFPAWLRARAKRSGIELDDAAHRCAQRAHRGQPAGGSTGTAEARARGNQRTPAPPRCWPA